MRFSALHKRQKTKNVGARFAFPQLSPPTNSSPGNAPRGYQGSRRSSEQSVQAIKIAAPFISEPIGTNGGYARAKNFLSENWLGFAMLAAGRVNL